MIKINKWEKLFLALLSNLILWIGYSLKAFIKKNLIQIFIGLQQSRMNLYISKHRTSFD